MLKLKDLVAIDEHAEFRNDVQLSDYDNAAVNLALLHSYLFTVTAPQGKESAVGLLRRVTDAFSNARLDNRIVVIANYGHGKSHLALVMANYFGKPYRSDEAQTILGKIAKAVDNPAQASRYREFRQNYPEYLVIRLRGDVPRSLREQFVAALEQALREHDATRQIRLPSWYPAAEDFLIRLSGDELTRANQFLESLNTEVAILLQDVRARSDNAYDTCRRLSAYLYGVPLDFGGEASMRELVNWVAKMFCGEGGPLGGVFVLFDEFSLYVQRYAQRNAAGELQDLLNGIEDQKGSAVFVAFAQHDPVSWAKTVSRTAQGLESLEKELTRIPRKLSLYSLMESVIDSYLTQPEPAWQALRSSQRIRGPLARASNLTLELFGKRYEDTLHWDTEKFDEIVTKGCFPLHPLTTALLCDLQLQAMKAAGNPRTVLGFVFEQINAKREEEAVIDNSVINWVLPVTLVEYFQDYLPESMYQLYENARRSLAPNGAAEQDALLKALLLQEAAKLPVRRENQVEFLAEAIGISLEVARSHLRVLSNAKVIRYDQGTRMYSFWPVAANPYRLEEILQQRLSGQDFTWELLTSLNKELDSVSVEVEWGHPEDWQATQKILAPEFFESNRLREFISAFKLSAAGEFQEGDRGCVIWLLAPTEEGVNWFRQNAAKVLDEACPSENPPPIVLMLPAKPVPELVEALQRKKILENFSQDDRQDVGTSIYEHEMNRLQRAMITGLASLRGDILNYSSLPRMPNSWIVPSPYRASLQVFGRPTLHQLLRECYGLAYRYSPPEFFSQYKEAGRGQSKLREAVRIVSVALLRNSLSSNREVISSNPVARDLSEKFLISTWHLVTADFRIQEPGNQRILQAWRLLEENCPAGARDASVSGTIIQLFNPPYGYDSNTATLLFCAWIGYYMHDLQISIQGRLATIDKLAELLTGGGRQFIQQLISQNIRLSRRDQGQIQREVQVLIEKANRDNFTQEEAQDIVARLQAFGDEQSGNTALTISAKQAAENLRSAFSLAEKYDDEAEEINKAIRGERRVDALIQVHRKISELPRLSNVLQTGPTPEQLHQDWLNRLTDMVNAECCELENVQRITQVERNQENLQYLKKQLNKAKLTDLADRVGQSLEVIKNKIKEIETREQEAPVQAEIRAVHTRADLATLYEFRERLQQITGYSEATMRLRNERLHAVEAEINQLGDFAKELVAAVDRLDGLAALDDWQQSFLRAYDRYQSTPFQQELDNADERVKELRKFLEELETIATNMPASLQEADNIRLKINALSSQGSQLASDVQKELLEQTRQKIDLHVQQQLQHTRQWLSGLEEELERGGKLLSIRERLQKQHMYMGEVEKAHWQELQKRVQARFDQDIVAQIESKFRSIRDREKRWECLLRLQQILDEEGNS